MGELMVGFGQQGRVWQGGFRGAEGVFEGVKVVDGEVAVFMVRMILGKAGEEGVQGCVGAGCGVGQLMWFEREDQRGDLNRGKGKGEGEEIHSQSTRVPKQSKERSLKSVSLAGSEVRTFMVVAVDDEIC